MWETVIPFTIFIIGFIGTILLMRVWITHTRKESEEVCYICKSTVNLRVGIDSVGRFYYICKECAGFLKQNR